jgi:pantoate--beta-alanine ligase
LIAARVGSTRLIDNVPVLLGAAVDHGPERRDSDAGE